MKSLVEIDHSNAGRTWRGRHHLQLNDIADIHTYVNAILDVVGTRVYDRVATYVVDAQYIHHEMTREDI